MISSVPCLRPAARASATRCDPRRPPQVDGGPLGYLHDNSCSHAESLNCLGILRMNQTTSIIRASLDWRESERERKIKPDSEN
jgi:hypothetical protein